ncbi:hypothetical protein [Bacillus sp. JJ722]|uniref:hypothetical protein n=1 Tax=Bacillus sp. JJ722 TaxID=3122973 RepID=UPI002FFEF342
MFPTTLTHHHKMYQLIQEPLTETYLKDLLLKHPYDIYAIVNENLEEQNEPMLTTFLVLHAVDFEDTVILFDVSRQHQSTVTTELCFLAKGYIESIDVGIVDRYPIKFYKREEKNENI